MKKLLLLLMTVCTFALVSAQTRTVRGQVVDASDNEPLIGATVLPLGGGHGTSTNADGEFHLTIPTSVKTIRISYVGMVTKEVAVKADMHISLEQNGQTLDDVLVVAYGTAKKESFTGSAEVIKAEKLNNRPVANITKALEGQVAGVQTTSGSGQPGSGVSVVIRGFGSMNASTAPLYVVDGVPYDGNIASINPNDIESMTILKDASAGALYGARGANGVVMITTKKGKEGKTTVNLKANWGFASRALPRYETLDEKGYVEMVFQSYKNNQITNNGLSPAAAGVAALNAMKSGSTRIFGANEQYNPFNYSITDLIDPSTGKVRSDAQLKYSEDWIDEAMRSNPLRQEYVATISGGTSKTNYMFGLGYLDEDGLLKTTNFKRYSGRMNVDSQITPWFKAGMNANYARRESNSSQENNSRTSNVWYSCQLMGPIFPVYEKNSDGSTVVDESGNKVFDYGANRPSGANDNWNTVATLYDNMTAAGSDNFSARTYFNLGDLKSGALQGLKFSVNYGLDLVNSSLMEYYNPDNGDGASVNGIVSRSTGRTFSYTLNELLTWNRKFGEHNFDVMFGHEYYKFNYQYLTAQKTGYPFGGIHELDGGSTIANASSYSDNYAIESVMSRVNYDYAGRYYLSASWRTDGSSRFAKGHRWGNFWSVGANWRLSEESFMKDFSWLNNLSVKASYGVQGNDNLLDSNGNSVYYAWQSSYDLGYSNSSLSGAAITSLENTEVTWEKNKNFNVGIEGRFIDRINASIEWYHRKTTDMLMSYPMASSLGFDGYSRNIGSMRNSGLEISLKGEILKTKDMYLALNWMGSTVSNKVLHLADKPEIISGSRIIKEGETMNSFYTATSAGVDPATGSQLFWVWDTDADGNRSEPYVSSNATKAAACKSIQGNRLPDLYGSFGPEFRYKNFDISMMFTYSIGGKVLDGVYNTLLYGNYIGQQHSAALNRAWRNPGDITDIPKIEIGKTPTITNDCLINASYLSMKNVTLGYTLPARISKYAKMDAVRFTAAADNLFMLTHLKGMNPQYNFSGGTNFGYTPTRMVTFGVDVTF